MEFNKNFLTKIEKSLIIGFMFSLIFSLLNFAGECNSISNKFFRLHILANSNSYEDQKFKMKIKEKIIACFKKHNNFGIKNLSDAKNKTIKNLDLIKNEISCKNSKIDLEVCKSYFGNRKYDGFTLPAGIYDSLLVTIGEGKGQNWWCIVFPPMCLPIAQEKNIKLDKNDANDILENLLPKNEKNIIENQEKYEIKFKIIDYYQKIIKITHEFIIRTHNNCFEKREEEIKAKKNLNLIKKCKKNIFNKNKEKIKIKYKKNNIPLIIKPIKLIENKIFKSNLIKSKFKNEFFKIKK